MEYTAFGNSQNVSTSPEEVAPTLRQIGAWLMQLSGDESSIDRPALPLPRDNESLAQHNDEELLGRLASDEYRWRQQRHQFFDPDLFGEPSWDILLDLYVSKIVGRSISITSACIGSNVPPTTALRWLTVLEERSLLVRKVDQVDKRRTWISISEHAFLAMNNYFSSKARSRYGREFSFASTIPRRAFK